MTDAPDGVSCGNCHRELDELSSLDPAERQPCPDCGSTARHIAKTFNSQVSLKSSLTVKARDQGKGKPFVEQIVGASWFKRDRRWHIIEQLVDRRNNRYRKKVVDEETGVVLRDDDGLLTDHQGFGSANKRKQE